jgi:hypothetical protein
MGRNALLCLLIFGLLLLNGCDSKNANNNKTESPQSSVTSNQTLYWIELQGRFNTKDLDRAQKEIPFKIILPSYLPNNQQNYNLPDIEGPLSVSQDNNIEVYVRYVVDCGNNLQGLLKISEINYELTLGNPESDPDLEAIKINNMTVIKTKDDWSSGMTYYYSFNSNDIYYIVVTHDIPVEETNKVVESIIKQIE